MLYGRDAERAQIGALLEDARASRSGALILRGEPGVGKTALLDDTRERAADMHVLTAHGVESESELPFAGLHQLMRPAVGHIDRLPEPQAVALRVALGLEAGTAHERFLVFAGCLSLLAELADRRPVLCVVDDAPWLDSASAEALLFVARRVDAEGIVMLFGAREGDLGGFDAAGIPSLALEGLDREAASTLLAREAGVDVDSSVLDRLLEQAQGNALALMELPSALTEAQLAGDEPLPETLPLTRQVERIFLERVRRLPDDTQRLLLIAAADDSQHLAVVLAAASGLGDSRSALDTAERAGLVSVHGTRLYFRHPLVRSAVYGAATSSERRVAHGALAAAIHADGDDADRRAWHLAASVVEPDDTVVRALVEAAARAQGRAAHVAAAKALEWAADLSADEVERGRLLVGAARCATVAGADDQAVRLATEASPLVQEPPLRAEIARSLALAQIRRGRPLDAAPLLIEAAREISSSDPAKALDLLLDATLAASDGGDFTVQTEISRLAVTIEPPQGDEPSAFVADFLNALGAIAAHDLERGVALLERVVRSAAVADDPRYGKWAALAAKLLGEEREVAALSRRAASLARARGAIGILVYALGTHAANEFVEQRFDEAELVGTEAAQFAHEIGAENPLSFLRALLAGVAAIRGEDEVALRQAEAALEHATSHGHRPATIFAIWALAILDLGRARWAEALSRLSSLATAPRSFADTLMMETAPDRIEAAVRTGRDAEAGEVLESLDAWASHTGAAWARPRLACCRALIAHGDDATAAYEEALELADDARPFDLARIHLLYGEHLRRERHRVDARLHLRSALETFGRLRAAPWAERAAAELRATGETARKRDPSTVEQLTPQELQIARFVAEGFSNKEVAAMLFLSPRTVDSHLRSVFAKLGLTSRTQLARLPLGDDVAPATVSA
ncbi:MAG TPA: AAA family ATPase [Gaiellaceae bacterium]|nr:AAA family ATPase [Gaiellaceae bacterium]